MGRDLCSSRGIRCWYSRGVGGMEWGEEQRLWSWLSPRFSSWLNQLLTFLSLYSCFCKMGTKTTSEAGLGGLSAWNLVCSGNMY